MPPTNAASRKPRHRRGGPPGNVIAGVIAGVNRWCQSLVSVTSAEDQSGTSRPILERAGVRGGRTRGARRHCLLLFEPNVRIRQYPWPLFLNRAGPAYWRARLETQLGRIRRGFARRSSVKSMCRIGLCRQSLQPFPPRLRHRASREGLTYQFLHIFCVLSGWPFGPRSIEPLLHLLPREPYAPPAGPARLSPDPPLASAIHPVRCFGPAGRGRGDPRIHASHLRTSPRAFARSCALLQGPTRTKLSLQ